MNNNKATFLQHLTSLIILYFTILSIQWTYETFYTCNSLLEDIVMYDTQVLNESTNSTDKKQYVDVFIESDVIDCEIWLSKWNIFDWSETKYIKKEHREYVFAKLNYWRQTGKLPTFYNLNIKSTFNFGVENGKDNS